MSTPSLGTMLALSAATVFTTALGCAPADNKTDASLELAASGPVTSGFANKCLDDLDGATADGNQIDIADCNGTAAQSWAYVNGTIVGLDGKCMSVANDDQTPGGVVSLFTCNGADAEKWMLSGTSILSSKGLCLDVKGESAANHTPLQVSTCVPGAQGQIWHIERKSHVDGGSSDAAEHDASEQTDAKLPGGSSSAFSQLDVLAGNPSGPGTADGVGSFAQFSGPGDMVEDASGNTYICDGQTIRKLVLATGQVTTLAGSPAEAGSADGTGAAARFNGAHGIAFEGGALYVADSGNYVIRKIVVASGQVTTIAGAVGGIGQVDGIGSAARFGAPNAIVADHAGNLYVADFTTIRKLVVATGAVTTVAGSPTLGGNVDGTGAAARFEGPSGLALDIAGANLYVSDAPGPGCTIRQVVLATAKVTTLAGGTEGHSDGVGTAASFHQPTGLALDGAGHLFVADSGNAVIREIELSSRTVSTLVGAAAVIGFADGIGSAAQFDYPSSLVSDAGALYVSDAQNHVIRKVDVGTKAVTTFAGALFEDYCFSSPCVAMDADGTGAAARFYQPRGIGLDGVGNAYLVDQLNEEVRRIVIATGAVTTTPTTYTGPHTAGSHYEGPVSAASDGKNLYVVDGVVIRKVGLATYDSTILAGDVSITGSADGAGVNARFGSPTGIAYANGMLFVLDLGAVRSVNTQTGVVTTIAGTQSALGSADGAGTSAQFDLPQALVADGAGNLFITDTGNDTIRKLVLATAEVSTVAGSVGVAGSADGGAHAARFDGPSGITIGPAGSLFVADTNNGTVRELDIATGAVKTVIGVAKANELAAGPIATARLHAPIALVYAAPQLLVIDSGLVFAAK